jgi:hypothetical protein
MVHQILHCGAGIARHRLPCGLDEPVVTVFRSGDGLRSGVWRRLRYASQNCFGESVHQCKQRLLPAANAEDIVRDAIKASSNPLVCAGQFGSPVQLIADRRPNERTWICIASGLRRLFNLTLLLPGEPDRDSGVAGCARMFHKNALYI